LSALLSKESILITRSGNRISVRYDKDQADEVLDEIIRTMETGENWSVSDHANTVVMYRGQQITLLSMSQIIGFGI